MSEPYGREELRYIAERYMDRMERHQTATLQYIADQSKWMIGQLFVANGGALVALTSSTALGPYLFKAGWCFVLGVISSIMCGLATWHHAGIISETCAVNPAMAFDHSQWPAADPAEARKERLWRRTAVVLGLISLVAFALGAVVIGLS